MKTIIFVEYQFIIVMKIVNYMQKLVIVKENAYYHLVKKYPHSISYGVLLVSHWGFEPQTP